MAWETNQSVRTSLGSHHSDSFDGAILRLPFRDLDLSIRDRGGIPYDHVGAICVPDEL